jgi:hypothetical protein
MSERSRIIERCSCGAVLDFQCRMNATRREQHQDDNEFLSRFRAEHVCAIRWPITEETP